MNSDSMVREGVCSTDFFLCASPRIVAATIRGELVPAAPDLEQLAVADMSGIRPATFNMTTFGRAGSPVTGRTKASDRSLQVVRSQAAISSERIGVLTRYVTG